MPGPGAAALTQTQGCALMELRTQMKREMLVHGSQELSLAPTRDKGHEGKEAESSTRGLSWSGLQAGSATQFVGPSANYNTGPLFQHDQEFPDSHSRALSQAPPS